MRRGGILGVAAMAVAMLAAVLGWSLMTRTGQAQGPGPVPTLARAEVPLSEVSDAGTEKPIQIVVKPSAINEAETGTFVEEPQESPSSVEEPEPSPSPAEVAEKGDKPKKKVEEELEPRNYSQLLKKPDELGFNPDENLFRNVYWHIRQSYVEKINEDQLFNGLKSEVANLLRQAKVPTDGLARLDKKKNVLVQLVDMYGDRVDRRLLVFAAILGMLDGLKDPYSVLMPPDEYRKLQEQMQARDFGGIGIYIELDRDNKNQLTIFEPIEGTPAYQAGLEAGDHILKIDGKSTEGITLDQAQASIRGKAGSSVNLTVRRKGTPQPLNFTVTRAQIQVKSVTHKMLPQQIGYVRLRQFGQETAHELEAALEDLHGKGAVGIILDLRNNGGGYIDAAVGVVGQFIRRGGLVVYTVNRQGERRDYNSSISGSLESPLVVLINEYSASASEITAGALRDHKVATLVGNHSFGKGSVQQLYPFPDESALKLTVARFYSPSGKVIDKKGIDPQVAVKMEPRFVGKMQQDIQLKKAVEVVQKQLATR
ncbi:MAG: S41 family peptidase [Candidatus Eremiobacterota bacterium]